MLPPFTPDGLLPVGDYPLTLDELRASVLVRGPEQDPIEHWDTAWRSHLVDNAEVLINQLWFVGIDEIYLNGSFVEAKPYPNDIDGYFVCDVRRVAGGDLQRELNALDPHAVWTWNPADRRAYRGFAKKQLPMWHIYRIELYPHYGQDCGIRDKHGNPLLFPAAFRRQRSTDKPKGIIRIKRK